MATSTTAVAAARVAGLCSRHNGHMVSMTLVRRCPRLLPAVMGVASRRQPAVWHTCSRRHMHATAAARLATAQQQQQEPDGSPASGSGSGSGTQQVGPVRGWRRLLFWRKQTPEHTGKRFRERGDEMSAQFREELEQVADMEPLAFRVTAAARPTLPPSRSSERSHNIGSPHQCKHACCAYSCDRQRTLPTAHWLAPSTWCWLEALEH